MIHLVVFRAKGNAHDRSILIGFSNKQAKSIPKIRDWRF
ncbi:hypothetical protein HPSA50_1576 [Helicobacter pylori SouthAfrica50]|uniref:Uncharacterized protein n=1 Tax=Helicobacter pylori SouthAfrica50 TaxID=1352357 RepID=T2S9H0_HELPX|nr:hypothetical protein HPSA50_1576 [Helicobacter pylori SouthAfrica50]